MLDLTECLLLQRDPFLPMNTGGTHAEIMRFNFFFVSSSPSSAHAARAAAPLIGKAKKEPQAKSKNLVVVVVITEHTAISTLNDFNS